MVGGVFRTEWLFARRIQDAAASRIKAEAKKVGLLIRTERLFARILDALASGVKAEAAVGVIVPVMGLFTRRILDADASEVKAEAPAVRTFVHAKCLFA